ncbi:hypothetical protein PMAYCL1PPCAC_00979, partial [Pristionchus mayeri]
CVTKDTAAVCTNDICICSAGWSGDMCNIGGPAPTPAPTLAPATRNCGPYTADDGTVYSNMCTYVDSGAVCNPDLSQPQCTCSPGYTGSICSEAVTTAATTTVSDKLCKPWTRSSDGTVFPNICMEKDAAATCSAPCISSGGTTTCTETCTCSGTEWTGEFCDQGPPATDAPTSSTLCGPWTRISDGTVFSNICVEKDSGAICNEV